MLKLSTTEILLAPDRVVQAAAGLAADLNLHAFMSPSGSRAEIVQTVLLEGHVGSAPWIEPDGGVAGGTVGGGTVSGIQVSKLRTLVATVCTVPVSSLTSSTYVPAGRAPFAKLEIIEVLLAPLRVLQDAPVFVESLNLQAFMSPSESLAEIVQVVLFVGHVGSAP